MTVERGGLAYSIAVSDEFSAVTQSFVTEMGRAERAWSEFKSAGGNVDAQTNRIADALNSLEKALARVTTEKERAAKASEEVAEAESKQERIERKLLEIEDKRAERAEILALADEKRIDITKKLTQELSIAEEARRQIEAQERKEAVALERKNQEIERGIRKTDEQIAAEKALEKVSKDTTRAFDAETEALKRKTRAQNEANVRNILNNQGLDASGRPVVPPPSLPMHGPEDMPLSGRIPQDLPIHGPQNMPQYLRDTADGQKLVQKAIIDTDDAGNRLLFTFRRLIGVFAAFQAIRFVFNEIRMGIESAVQFNAEVESSTLGIASLITAAGDVRDALGNMVPPVERLRLAQIEARRQMVLLRQEGKQTSATFEELNQAFQVAIAPGIQAGLSVDQIRKFTVQISQAAQALNMEQRQLPEEIRSLLAGTIRKGSTRIATTLGIENADIVAAKEAGKLFEFLQKKFEAFSVAGEEGLKTFNIQLANFKKGLEEAAGAGASGFFDSLKGIVGDADKGIASPSAVAGFKQIGDALAFAVERGRELFDSMSGGQVVVAAIADTIKILAVGIQVVVEGLGIAVSILSALFEFVAKIVGFFTSLLGLSKSNHKTMVDIGAAVVAILTIVKVVETIMAAWKALASFIKIETMLTAIASASVQNIALGIVTAMALAAIAQAAYADEAQRAAGESATMSEHAKAIAEAQSSAQLSISASRADLEDNVKLMEQLRKDSVKAAEALASGLATIGLTGGGAQQIKDVMAAEAKGREDARKMLQEQVSTEKQLAALRTKNAEDRLGIEKRLTDARLAALLAEQEVQRTKGMVKVTGPDGQISDIHYAAAKNADTAAAKVKQIQGELNQAVGEEKALVEKIADIKADILKVEQETLAAGMQRVRLVAEQESFRLAADLRIREASLIMERAKLDVLRAQAESGNRFSAGTSNILGATAESNQAKVLLDIHTQDARMQEDALQDQARFARQTYETTVKTLDQAVTEKKEAAEIAVLKKRAMDQLLTATSVEEQLRLLRRDNILALQQEKEKRDAILGVVLLTTRIESSENSKNLVAQAALSASTLRNLKAKSDLLKQDEATAFRMTAQEKALAAATADVAEANDQIAEKRRRFAEEEARLQEKIKAAGAAPGGLEASMTLSQELFDLQKKHNAELDVDLAKQKKITDELHLQIEAASVRNARQIGDEALPAAQAGAQAQGLQNRAAGTSGITAQRLSTQAELTTARASLEIMRTKAQIQAQALQRELTALRGQQAPLSTIEAKEAEIARARALSTAELERQQLAIDGLNAKLDQAATDAKAVALQLGTFIESTFTGLADTLGSALADALDPTKKIDMKERFRAFFAGIFQQLATFLLTVALFVVALNAIPGFAAVMEMMGGMGAAGAAARGLTGTGGAVGKAEGGRVGAGGAPSMAHFGARGFAGGGRPAGLDPTDTVAIWAAPDEWVIRAQSARAYGADVMSAINEGMIDPSTLQGLAGAHRVSTATSRSSPGFAAGGRIPARASSPGSGSGGPKILPVMPVSEATLDLMLSVGEGALKRSLKKNASYLRSIIGNSK